MARKKIYSNKYRKKSKCKKNKKAFKAKVKLLQIKQQEKDYELSIDSNAETNKIDQYNRSLLYWAAYDGDLKQIQEFIKSGSQLDQADIYGETPLYWAAYNNKLEAVKLLLNAGASPNALTNHKETALYASAFCNNIAISKLLIEFNANTNIITEYNRSAVYWFAYHGHIDIVMQLLQSESDAQMTDKAGKTPISISKERHPKKFKKLIETIEFLDDFIMNEDLFDINIDSKYVGLFITQYALTLKKIGMTSPDTDKKILSNNSLTDEIKDMLIEIFISYRKQFNEKSFEILKSFYKTSQDTDPLDFYKSYIDNFNSNLEDLDSSMYSANIILLTNNLKEIITSGSSYIDQINDLHNSALPFELQSLVKNLLDFYKHNKENEFSQLKESLDFSNCNHTEEENDNIQLDNVLGDN